MLGFIFQDLMGSSMVSNFLIYLLLSTVTVYCLGVLWKRRRLYRESMKLSGPLALPFIGSALHFMGNPYDIFGEITNMFAQYPPIFRVWFANRMFYAVSDAKYFELLLTSPHALKKENLYSMASPILGQGLFTALSVPHWRKHRKLIIPTFNQKILDGFVEVFVQQSEILVRVLEKSVGKGEIDVLKIMSACTLDIITETAMGVQLNAQTTDCKIAELLDRLLEIIMTRIFNIIYHSEFIFKHSQMGRDFYAFTKEIRSLAHKILHKKRTIRAMKSPDELEYDPAFRKRQAFLDLLMDINEEGGLKFTDEELMDETMTIMTAGTDTSASTDCFVLTMMGLHQNIQNEVLNEILEVVGPTESINLTHLPQLKLLERVIKETLRLFPVGGFFVRTAEQDIDLGICTILKGCSIVFGVLNLHRNEKYYPDPYKFDPDRFLPEEIAKRPPGAFVPFSYGPRNCIGMKYAIMAMKTVLANVLRKYRVFTSYQSVEAIELKTNLVLRPRHGYKVSFELR
ncbi:cytochrome P450 4C1-like isoform X2 [Euwallacea fornicatus]|uniref:cytochrome P450 4C1-like isoform X2 n=1 Tax=Euwallacea fornicatus TaxID=995702 RepID=UPI00338F91E8